MVVSKDVACPHDIETLPLPFELWFLKVKGDASIVNVSLLWEVPGVHNYGIDHATVDMFMDDALHTSALGVEAAFVGECLASTLDCDCFVVGVRGVTERGLQALRARMKKHYKQRRVTQPGRKPCRIKFLTSKMINGRTLKAHGGETRDLIPFAIQLMREFSEKGERFQLLAESGKHLANIIKLLRDRPRKLDEATLRALMVDAKSHVVLYRLAGGHLFPKHHSFMHMLYDARRNGNPAMHATWEDEHENGVAAKLARKNHPSTFAISLFRKEMAKEQLPPRAT